MLDTTRVNIGMFWDPLDETLNAVLFALIGLEVIVISFFASLMSAGLIVIAAGR